MAEKQALTTDFTDFTDKDMEAAQIIFRPSSPRLWRTGSEKWFAPVIPH